MKDIDGYVTKDELYRLISHIKMNPDIVVDDKMCHTIVNAISDIPQTDVQPVNQWISINERVPESEKEVLVWYKYTWDAWFTSYGFGINVWYSNTKQWRDGCLLKGVEVLYWQPLPKPPKDGDTE